jgi:chromosome segregation ATPase
VAERDDECAALKRDLDRWRARVAEESQRRTALEGQMKGREEKWAAVESNAAEVTYLEGKLAEARVEIKKLHDELAAAREERDKMAESVKETGRGSTETSRKLQREIEALKLRHETELTLLRQELDEQHDLAQKSIDQLRSKFKAQLVTVTAQSEESRGDEAEFRRVKRKLDREVHDLSEKLESERMERGKDLRTIESLTRLNKTLREKLDKVIAPYVPWRLLITRS